MFSLRFVRLCLVVPLASGLALALSLASTRARAEEPVRLSVADALSRASERAPEVAFARHVLRDAEARRVGAGLVMPVNPRLSVDARPTLRGGSASNIGYAASVDFLFDVGGAPSARREEARRHVAVGQSELRVQRLESRARAWSAYQRALIAEQRVKEISVAVELARRVLAASKERAEAGAAGDIEQSLAQSEVSQLEAGVNAVQQRRELEIMALRDALDLSALTPVSLSTALADPTAVANAEALARKALDARPDLEAIRKRIDLLVATEDRLEREIFPRVGGYLGVDASPLAPMYGIVGLSVELPLVQRNQGPIARAVVQREGETERLALEARRIVRDVYAAYTAFEARRRELRVLTEGALPTAQRTLELVESGWRSGRFDIFRVTSAARDLARVRGLRLDALEAAWMERIALDRAVGGLDS